MSDEPTIYSPRGVPESAPQPTGKKFCVQCGNELAADAAFCGACGLPVGAVPVQPPAPPPAPQPYPPAYPPPAQPWPQAGPYPPFPGYGMPAMRKKAGIGHFISGSGALLAIVSFFLPWLLISCSGQELARMNGWQLAVGMKDMEQTGMDSGSPILLALLVLAFLAAVLVILIFIRGRFGKWEGFAFIAAGVAAAAILTIFLLANQPSKSDMQFAAIEIKPMAGLFMTYASYLLLVVGGALCLKE